ncbi:Sfi1-domain-containing protein [Ascodesmis nigricans]|uniref:Sfi1-domain-containing protein n=1 Tax=Ascodesmis nigricans TaxID=341454 RepID=A0A4S2N6E1_9PEZI|nr:Sfi1-domain-containing protein [Ascodesmis nigricans]
MPTHHETPQEDDHHHYAENHGDMPSRGDSAGRNSAPYTYTQHDLEILHEVISLATIGPSPQSQSIAAVWSAYDVVLTARGLDPINGCQHLYKFILRLQGAPGRDMQEKFWHQVKEMGGVGDESRFEEPSEEVVGKYREKIREVEEEERGYEEEEGRYAGQVYGERNGYQDVQKETRSRATVEVRGSTTDRPLKTSHVVEREWEDNRVPDREQPGPPRNDDYGDGMAEAVHQPAARPRIPDDLVEEGYEMIERNLLQRYFHHWLTATEQRQDARYFEEAYHVAAERHRLSLLKQFWSLWASRAAEAVERSDIARQRLLARKYFTAWRSVVQQNEDLVQQFQLAGPFYQWRVATRERLEDAQMAEQYYNEGLIRAVYHVWFRRLQDVKAERMRNQALLEDAFHGWRERTEKELVLKAKAKTFYRRFTLHKFLLIWEKRSETSLDNEVVAIAFQNVSSSHIQQNVLALWRRRTQNQIAAKELYKKNLIKRFFKNWTLIYRQQVFQDFYSERLVSRVFIHWQQQQRAILLRRTIEYRNARQVLRVFVTNLRIRSRRLNDTLIQFTVARNQRIASEALHQWRVKLANIKSLTAVATTHYGKTLLNTSFYNWHSRTVAYTTDYHLIASAFRNFFAMQHIFSHLRLAARNHKKNRLKAAFHTVSRLRLFNLASRVLTHWRSRTHHITVTLPNRADNTLHTKNRAVMATYLSHWREKTNNHLTQQYEYTTAYNSGLLLRALETWTSHLRRLRHLDELAEQRRREADIQLVARMVGKWRQRYWKLEPDYKLAERERQRNDVNLMKRTLDKWRDRTRRALGIATSPTDTGVEDDLQLSPRRHIPRGLSTSMTPLAQRVSSPARWSAQPKSQVSVSSSVTALPQQQIHRRQQPPATLPYPITLPANHQSMTPLGSPVKRKLFARSTLGRIVSTVDEDSGEWAAPITTTTTTTPKPKPTIGNSSRNPSISRAPPATTRPPSARPPSTPPPASFPTRTPKTQPPLRSLNPTSTFPPLNLHHQRTATPELGQRRVREYIVQQQKQRGLGIQGRRTPASMGRGIVEEDENGAFEDEDETEGGVEMEMEMEDEGTLVGTGREGSKGSGNGSARGWGVGVGGR